MHHSSEHPQSVASPTGADRRVLSRFTWGINNDVLQQVSDAGSVTAWFNQQLYPQNIPDGFAESISSWFPVLQNDPRQLFAGSKAGHWTSYDVSEEFDRWTLLRRAYSTHSVHEAMVDFWSNLLHVPSPLAKCWPARVSYDKVIRKHALGRFDKMLQEAIVHPAMLCYLDCDVSTAENMNENLGREVLECHTVGVDGGYVETDIDQSARILTGWTVDKTSWRHFYDQVHHSVGPVRVMGFRSTNANPDGRQLVKDYLEYLATRSSTATRLARRLAVRFVSDHPSSALVNSVARAYLSSGTKIRPMLQAMVSHPDFAKGIKVRTPVEDYIASMRALQVQVQQPHSAADFANLCSAQCEGMGQVPFDWPRPDGFPDIAEAWTSTSRMLGSWKVHYSLSQAARPSSGVTYKDVDYWLPQLPMKFSDLVATVCQTLLFQPVTSNVLGAACIACSVGATEQIDANHPFIRFHRTPMLLACLLDSNLNMTR